MSDKSTLNILANIVADKRLEIANLKQQKPLATFIDDLKPSNKNMYAALTRSEQKPYAGFILECKKASPSKGLIRDNFDVKSISEIYNNYAAAISVLTDKKYFQGSYDDLKTVAATVDCPVLNKDFFIDEYQVYLARYYGADAILLMLSVLTDEEYLALAKVANQYQLAILTEVSTAQECQRAVNLNAKMIGINNRDLRDLSTDIERTFSFAPLLPKNAILISESGIYTNNQVRKLAPAVSGFLVGSSIMAEENIALACRKLIYGNIKICGLTSIAQAQQVCSLGGLYGGLIFAQESPRYITPLQAKQIVSQVPQLNYVAVFVNEKHEKIITLIENLSLYAVQLHGDEDQAYIESLRAHIKLSKQPNCQIWQAVAVENSLTTLPQHVEHIVLDGKQAGSGKTFNWQALTTTKQDLSSCFLAGGLSNKNITNAVEILRQQSLYGLDVNSGVERRAGEKCPEKLAQLFSTIRNY
jgi:indole-3-glycerol phosphate synthase/phosphoribosylanthranilate isomerase